MLMSDCTADPKVKEFSGALKGVVETHPHVEEVPNMVQRIRPRNIFLHSKLVCPPADDQVPQNVGRPGEKQRKPGKTQNAEVNKGPGTAC